MNSNTDHPEATLQCPYNPAHVLLRFRIYKHLEKCRKQHPKEVKETSICQYNTCHVVPTAELSIHHEFCSDRGQYDTFLRPTEKKQTITVPIESLANLTISTDNSWDEEANNIAYTTVLDTIHQNCEKKDIIRELVCATKSEKKAFRAQEHARRAKLRNACETSQSKCEEDSAETGSMVSNTSFITSFTHAVDDDATAPTNLVRNSSYQRAARGLGRGHFAAGSEKEKGICMIDSKISIGRGGGQSAGRGICTPSSSTAVPSKNVGPSISKGVGRGL